MCDVPVVTACNDAEPTENSGGEILADWTGQPVDLTVGKALRDGCETANLTVEASGRTGTDSLLAAFTLTLDGDSLTLHTAQVELYPGSSSGGDVYSNTWTDTAGLTQTSDLSFTLEQIDGWWLRGTLGGTLRGLDALEGQEATLSGSFDLRTISVTTEQVCPE